MNQISYSHNLGNGFALSFGADERQTKSVFNLSSGTALKVGSEPENSYAGMLWPDVHIDFRTNQDWGHINTSAIVHNISATYYNAPTSAGGLSAGLPLVCVPPALAGTSQCGHPSDRWGWTLASGGEIKLPQGDGTDRIGFFALYARGKGGGQALASQALFGPGSKLAVGWMSDGAFVNGSRIELTTAWATGLGFEHAWSSSFRTAIFGAYEQVHYSAIARSWFCGLNGAVPIANITFANCGSPNWAFFQGTFNARWAPVTHFELVAEAWYVNVFSGFAGAATLNTLSTGARPIGPYVITNQSLRGAAFRAIRYFNAGGG